jgi:hypothetical protein
MNLSSMRNHSYPAALFVAELELDHGSVWWKGLGVLVLM